MVRSVALGLGLLASTVALGAATAEPGSDAIASARTAIQGLTPKDVGARYGQALGAIEICIGAKVTDKGNALNSIYTGADLEAFKAQAGKIYDAWVKVKNCVHQDDPNQCKVIMDESCAAAIAEIGPSGSAIPGLLDPPPPRTGSANPPPATP